MVDKEVDNWLRSLLDNDLSSQVLFVIAGRDQLEKVNLEWQDWQPIIREMELQPFSNTEISEYLRLCGITDKQLTEKIATFSGNLPWAETNSL